MIASKKPVHIINFIDVITQLSIQFASAPDVDFIVFKEGIMTFEKITIYQQKSSSDNSEAFKQLTEANTHYLFKIMALLENNLGTESTDWFCAAEALINCIFNLKDKKSREYAKLFL